VCMSHFTRSTHLNIIFAFEDQCDDSLHASILASLSSMPPSHEAPFSVQSSSSLELKPLPDTLKCAFLGPNETFPVMVTNDLNSVEEIQVLNLLMENKEALGWTLGDIHGISLTIVQHRIHLEHNAKLY